MTVALTATRVPDGADVTIELDGIELAVNYTLPPAERLRVPAAGSCLLTAPYDAATPAGTCALLAVSSGATVRLHGPVYAPLAAVDLAVVGESVSLDRGVAARTIFLDTGPAPLPPHEPDRFPPCRIQGSSSPADTRAVDFVTQPPATPTDDPYVEVSAIVVFTDQQAPACDPVTTTTEVSDWVVGSP
jgi:hypothetical protein